MRLNPNEQWLTEKLSERQMLAGIYQEALEALSDPLGPLCRAEFGTTAGEPVLCDLRHHGENRKHYNRELKVHWW